MFVLKIEHPVPDFGNWKRVFDNDPAKRKNSGVKRYRIFKAVDDPNFVVVELEFDDLKQAQAMHEMLKKLWKQVEGQIINGPQSNVIELIEAVEY